jgi:hypothetical protein
VLYTYRVGEVTYTVKEDKTSKACDASDGSYHYRFNKLTGSFRRWGQTEEDDPQFCPAGPEILDLEVAAGLCKGSCPFCYKGNSATQEAKNMTLETFKLILAKMPKTLTQVAFGICDLQGNPDFFSMMKHARANGVIPNFTMSGTDLTPKLADEIVSLCGAVAVSVYQTDKNVGYDAIKLLTDRGMKQCNIHLFVSEESFPFVCEVMQDRLHDSRLRKMNAVVLLGVKPKGRAKGRYTPLTSEKFKSLVMACLMTKIPIGFDSCSAPKFERFLDDPKFSEEAKKKLKEVSESCESTLFSSYVNWKGEFFPCSFCEGEGEWTEGVSVLNAPTFMDVWQDPRVQAWREKLLASSCNGCRSCIAFPEVNLP